MARSDAAPAKNIVEAMEKHFLGDDHEYGIGREPTNVEQMAWVYGKTGNKELDQPGAAGVRLL